MTLDKFIVIDTEGADTLTEIAIFNQDKDLIYEAFVATAKNINNLKRKKLPEIIADLQRILPNQNIICHHAEHDAKIIKNSFIKCRQRFPSVKFICTLKLALEIYPLFPSHNLEFLSKKLFLQVNQHFFQKSLAHRARYDAEFTLQLYLQLQSKLMTNNPFSSNRVDNPFQNHLDFTHIYQNQFNYLKSIITEIKNDPNHQSKAALVIGEAGSGKTHLMMRLAQATLKTNRLLYIRQPNNPQSVIHHIYARILESFAQKVSLKNGELTQLELLLARSFTDILKQIAVNNKTDKLNHIIEGLENDNSSLYQRLGKEGTQTHRNNWKYIETKITDWWRDNYSAGGYAHHILQGIIKFCNYKDNPIGGINYKDQVRQWLSGDQLDTEISEKIGLKIWQEDLSREDFALEAISLFGQLSTLDEPLIIVFDQLESLIQDRRLLISFGVAVREILTYVPNSLIILNLFPDRWENFKQDFDDSTVDRLSQHYIQLTRPSDDDLVKILSLRCEAAQLDLFNLFAENVLNKILQETSIRKVINCASDYYRYKVEGIPLPHQVSVSVLSVEERLTKLEQTLAQIVQGLSLGVANTNIIPLPSPPLPDLKKYLSETEKNLNQDYDKPHIITDDDDYGKLVKIMEVFKTYDSNLAINHLHLGKKVLPNHLSVSKNERQYAIAFLHHGGSIFTNRIKNFNLLVNQYPHIQFTLLRDQRENPITGKIGQEEIAKLNATPNGQFMVMNQENRVIFELIYKMIVDIQEQDLEVDLETAISMVISEYKDYWLIQKLFDN